MVNKARSPDRAKYTKPRGEQTAPYFGATAKPRVKIVVHGEALKGRNMMRGVLSTLPAKDDQRRQTYWEPEL